MGVLGATMERSSEVGRREEAVEQVALKIYLRFRSEQMGTRGE